MIMTLLATTFTLPVSTGKLMRQERSQGGYLPAVLLKLGHLSNTLVKLEVLWDRRSD